MRMFHSDLARRLMDAESRFRAELDAIVKDTGREGVQAEGGDIVGKLEPITESAHGEAAAPITVAVGTGFTWGNKSKNELHGVEPRLVECATLALMKFTRIDFCCYDGLRTAAEQAANIKAGTSQLKVSKHQTGLALDLVPIIGGIPKWDWTGCYEIAMAMDKAATQLGYEKNIRWGGAWDKTLADFGGEVGAYSKAVEDYKKRHAGSDFIDGPHFEWIQ